MLEGGGVNASLDLSFPSFLYSFLHSANICWIPIMHQALPGSWRYNSKQNLCSHNAYILVYSRQINTFRLALSAVRENQAGGGDREGWWERRVYIWLCWSRTWYTVLGPLMVGIDSEQCIMWFHRCASIIEGTYTNLDGVAHDCHCTVYTFIWLAVW